MAARATADSPGRPAEGHGRLADVVGTWVAGLRWDEIPPYVQEATIRGTLHSVACGAGGYNMPETLLALGIARQEAESGPCTILVHGDKVPTATAIFVNAVMFCALEQQEMHPASATHPFEVIVPAVLAIAERRPVGGTALLESILAGSEVMMAMATAGLDSMPQTATGSCLGAAVYGSLGAAVSAARLMGLDSGGIALALAHAANFASGLNESNLAGLTEYHYALAHASRSGYFAAQLAAAGAEAAPMTFEGASGFYHRFAELGASQVEAYDFPAVMRARLGQKWEITEQFYKRYPVHFYNLPFVDAAKGLRERHRLGPDEIDAIRVTLNNWCLWCNGADPGPYSSREQTRGATAFAVATMLARGRFGLTEAADPAAPDIAALARRTRVAVSGDPASADDWRSVHIEVDARGETYTWDTSTDGIADYRLGMADIQSIARSVLSQTLAASRVAPLIAALTGLDRLSAANALIPMLTRETWSGSPCE